MPSRSAVAAGPGLLISFLPALPRWDGRAGLDLEGRRQVMRPAWVGLGRDAARPEARAIPGIGSTTISTFGNATRRQDGWDRVAPTDLGADAGWSHPRALGAPPLLWASFLSRAPGCPFRSGAPEHELGHRCSSESRTDLAALCGQSAAASAPAAERMSCPASRRVRWRPPDGSGRPLGGHRWEFLDALLTGLLVCHRGGPCSAWTSLHCISGFPSQLLGLVD